MIKFRLQPSRFYDSQNCDNWLNFSRSTIGSTVRRVSVCRLCGSRSDQQEICAVCKNELPWRITPWQQHLPNLDGVWAAFDFAYPIRQITHRVKYGRDMACTRLLGELLTERLSLAVDIPRTGTLFPVPLARGRM
jgi:predicted amidophosphoribosyltransferase